MKKQYITPTSTTICLRSTAKLLTASQNEYSNNQGCIHFESTEVDAKDGD